MSQGAVAVPVVNAFMPRERFMPLEKKSDTQYLTGSDTVRFLLLIKTV